MTKWFSQTALLGIVLGVVYLVFLHPYLDMTLTSAHDPASYLLRAESFWSTYRYGELFADGFFPVTSQMPGLTLLLIPLVGIFGVNFVVLKLFMVLLAGGMAVAAGIFFRRFLEPEQKPEWATLVLMASPVVFMLAHRILAEIPLVLFVMLALVWMDRYLREEGPVVSRTLFGAVIFITAAYLMKITALGLMAGGWFLLVHKRYRTPAVFRKLLACSLMVAVPVLLWEWWCSTVPMRGYWAKPPILLFVDKDPMAVHYTGMISAGEFLVKVRHNLLWGMLGSVGTVFNPPLFFVYSEMKGVVLSIPFVLWLAFMWIRSFRRQPSVLEGFVLFGLMLLSVATAGYAHRYMMPLFPAFIVYGFRSLEGAWRLWVPRAVFALGFAASVVVGIQQWVNPYGTPEVRDYLAIAREANSRYGKGTVGITPLPAHWQVLTDHRSFAGDTAGFDAIRRGDRSVRYAVGFPEGKNLGLSDPRKMENVTGDLLKRTLKITRWIWLNGGKLKLVARNGTFGLYEVVP
ncbi:MAG: hypothetical protein NC910_03615 [Candidatus Omnitrophica bacterium]|nr:hypothetical protein [Candidatus Omnitrophota bacterium]